MPKQTKQDHAEAVKDALDTVESNEKALRKSIRVLHAALAEAVTAFPDDMGDVVVAASVQPKPRERDQ